MGIFDQIFFKDDSLTAFNNALNQLNTTLTQNQITDSPVQDTDLTSEIINQFIEYDSKQNTNSTYDPAIERLLSQISVPQEKLERYQIYQEVASLPLVKRIIKAYISNILQKNPTSGHFLLYRRTSDSVTDEEFKTIKHNLKNIVKYYKLADKLRYRILPQLLTLGDSYVEVIDVNAEYEKLSKQSEKTLQLLTEHISSLSDKLSNGYGTKATLDNALDILASTLIETDSILPLTEAKQSIKQSSSQTVSYEDVIIRVHHPKNIVKLIDKYGNLYGYVEVLEELVTDNLAQNIGQLFTRVTYLNRKLYSTQDQSNITNRLINQILKKILLKHSPNKTLPHNIKQFENIANKLDDSVYKFLKKLIIQSNALIKKDSNTIKKVRFIPTHQMVNFAIPSEQYYPDGEPIIDPLVLPSKMLLLSQLANVIAKLSRAALIRKWTIDVGPRQMQAGLIQKLKRELYNTRVTIDSLNSFKTISNILSDYKDMFILAKNGQRSIDVEVQSLGDPTVKVADIEDSRHEIMTLSGIPAVYLGAEAPELREAIVHSNICFATEISDLQEIINRNFNRLLDMVHNILYKQNSSTICTVTLVPPVVLILQLIEMTLSSVGNIAGVFNSLQLPFDPYLFLEKYVPYEDWQAFRKRADEYMTNLQLKQNASGQAQGSAGQY